MTEDEYYDAQDRDEASVAHICEDADAMHIYDDIFEREDGSRFRVVTWPERERDYDSDEETGRIYPCGWTWTQYTTEEMEDQS